MTLKIIILRCLRRLFIILVSLTITLFNESWSSSWIFSIDFFSERFDQHRKMTLKVWILRCLRRLFIILVSLTMTWFSEKMLISTRCILTWFHVQLDSKNLERTLLQKSAYQRVQVHLPRSLISYVLSKLCYTVSK